MEFNAGGPGSIVKASEHLRICAGFRFNDTVFTKDCDFSNAQITVLEDRSLELKVGGEVVDLATADFIQH